MQKSRNWDFTFNTEPDTAELQGVSCRHLSHPSEEEACPIPRKLFPQRIPTSHPTDTLLELLSSLYESMSKTTAYTKSLIAHSESLEDSLMTSSCDRESLLRVRKMRKKLRSAIELFDSSDLRGILRIFERSRSFESDQTWEN